MPQPGKPAKLYDLSRRDVFWAQHRGQPFPEASQAIETALAAYKTKEQSVRAINEGPAADVSDNTARLNDAVK